MDNNAANAELAGDLANEDLRVFPDRGVVDWLLRVGDGEHLMSALDYGIWGMDTKNKGCVPYFLRTVRPGDRLWFIVSQSKGKAIVVATFVRHTPRELGPLVAVSRTNEELGWTHSPGEWDTEIHYTDAFKIGKINVLTEIMSPLVVRMYDPEKCTVNLPQEYANIIRYSMVERV